MASRLCVYAGMYGQIIGSISIGWGVISLLMHVWLRGHKAAVHIPLLRQG